jgi:hypothetical protein
VFIHLQVGLLYVVLNRLIIYADLFVVGVYIKSTDNELMHNSSLLLSLDTVSTLLLEIDARLDSGLGSWCWSPPCGGVTTTSDGIESRGYPVSVVVRRCMSSDDSYPSMPMVTDIKLTFRNNTSCVIDSFARHGSVVTLRLPGPIHVSKLSIKRVYAADDDPHRIPITSDNDVDDNAEKDSIICGMDFGSDVLHIIQSGRLMNLILNGDRGYVQLETPVEYNTWFDYFASSRVK